MTSRIVVEHDAPLSTITLDDAESGNALDEGLLVELGEALGEADREPSTNAIVLRAAGPSFTVGYTAGTASPDAVPRVQRQAWHLFHRILGVEKPIIAMVHGLALGLGLSIVALCDCSIIAEDAVIGDGDVTNGLVASSSFILPLLIGPQRAKELLLIGAQVQGARAAELGMVTHAVPAASLEATAHELARACAAQPAYATRATKLVVNRYVRWIADKLGDVSLAYTTISAQIDEHNTQGA